MTSGFYIEKRNDGSGRLLLKNRPVFMTITFNGTRVRLGTGVKADLASWDEKEQKIKAGTPGSNQSNALLNSLVAAAESAMKMLEFSGNPMDPENFRELFNRMKPKHSGGFFDVFLTFMESNSNRWSSSTFRKIRNLYRHLKEFEGQRGRALTFQGMDQEFLNEFTSFYKEKGYSDSTLRKAINNLVWFLNWATEHGYNIFREYRQYYRSMGPPRVLVRSQVFLRWEELLHLLETETSNRRMERVKDLFCFSCFTGIRYAELVKMKKDDIRGEEAVIRSHKGSVRKVTINSHAGQILDKYSNRFYLGNTLFPVFHPATMNKHLRMLGKRAGLDRLVPTPGNPAESLPLYELMTTGIAVNTFISNAIQLEVPFSVISEFTGVRRDKRIMQIRRELSFKSNLSEKGSQVKVRGL